jgi:hypothetical protein
MNAMSRRTLIMNFLPGAVVAVAGAGTIALAIAPEAANAVSLGASKAGQMKVDHLVEEAQVVVVGSPHRRRHRHHRRHRRHHRRWVCWWHRGRRVCGWR